MNPITSIVLLAFILFIGYMSVVLFVAPRYFSAWLQKASSYKLRIHQRAADLGKDCTIVQRRLMPYQDLTSKRYLEKYESAVNYLRLAQNLYRGAIKRLRQCVLPSSESVSAGIWHRFLFHSRAVGRLTDICIRLLGVEWRSLAPAEQCIHLAHNDLLSLTKNPKALLQECQREIQQLPLIIEAITVEETSGIDVNDFRMAVSSVELRLRDLECFLSEVGTKTQAYSLEDLQRIDKAAQEFEAEQVELVQARRTLVHLNRKRIEVDRKVAEFASFSHSTVNDISQKGYLPRVASLVSKASIIFDEAKQARFKREFPQALNLLQTGHDILALTSQLSDMQPNIDYLTKVQVVAFPETQKAIDAVLHKYAWTLTEADQRERHASLEDLIGSTRQLSRQLGQVRSRYERELADSESRVAAAELSTERDWNTLQGMIGLQRDELRNKIDRLGQRYRDSHNNPAQLEVVRVEFEVAHHELLITIAEMRNKLTKANKSANAIANYRESIHASALTWRFLAPFTEQIDKIDERAKQILVQIHDLETRAEVNVAITNLARYQDEAGKLKAKVDKEQGPLLSIEGSVVSCTNKLRQEAWGSQADAMNRRIDEVLDRLRFAENQPDKQEATNWANRAANLVDGLIQILPPQEQNKYIFIQYGGTNYGFTFGDGASVTNNFNLS